jgi:hypothetical protein
VVAEFGPGGVGADFDALDLGGPVLGKEDVVDVVGVIFVVPGRVDGGDEDEERFLSARADTFAGASVKEKASANSVRNDGGGCVAAKMRARMDAGFRWLRDGPVNGDLFFNGGEVFVAGG